MAERAHLDWFRERLAASRAIEPKDPAPILAWREQQRNSIRFKADLIGLDDVRGWSRDEGGNVRHKSGQFFGVEGVRVESGDLREVASWDQPIYTQPEGGILGLLARETRGKRRRISPAGKAEPGNIGVIQLSSDDSEHVVQHPARPRRQAPADGGSAHRRSRRADRLPGRTQ